LLWLFQRRINLFALMVLVARFDRKPINLFFVVAVVLLVQAVQLPHQTPKGLWAAG
jgi:hypothetical protein